LTPIYKDPLEQMNFLQKAQVEYQLNGTMGIAYQQSILDQFTLNSSMVCILNV